eukprot:SAG31_NODE_240_length_19407_cov_29.686140_4_plen_122_part_00
MHKKHIELSSLVLGPHHTKALIANGALAILLSCLDIPPRMRPKRRYRRRVTVHGEGASHRPFAIHLLEGKVSNSSQWLLRCKDFANRWGQFVAPTIGESSPLALHVGGVALVLTIVDHAGK